LLLETFRNLDGF